MRERVTFFHDSAVEFDPQQLHVAQKSLRVKNLKAAREDRLTFGVGELPQEIRRVLEQCYELHIRWSSPFPYPAISPLNARVSPGLHVHFTPHQNRSQGQESDLLCPILKKAFGSGLKCSTPEETFTKAPVLSERFASSATYQYHQLLPSLSNLGAYLTHSVCSSSSSRACTSRAAAIAAADYVDLDFDSVSHAVTVTAYRHRPVGSSADGNGWNEEITATEGGRHEVGVLAAERAGEPEELKLGGWLTVLGQDEKPKPTLFSFPSRHHADPSHAPYTASFLSPTGLHPTLRLSFPAGTPPPPPSASASADDTPAGENEDKDRSGDSSTPHCALHAHLTLPSALFPDRYQLAAPLFLASKNLRQIRAIAGETDLELPDWAVGRWGSTVLVELAPPRPSSPSPSRSSSGSANSKSSRSKEEDEEEEEGTSASPWSAEIPLHLRYLPPAPGGAAPARLPWPVVFWACAAEGGSKMAVNPFDRTNLGYDGAFGARTMFYHLEPAAAAGNGSTAAVVGAAAAAAASSVLSGVGGSAGLLVEALDVPVLDSDRVAWLEVGTGMTIALGLVWVLWRLLGVAAGGGSRGGRGTAGLGGGTLAPSSAGGARGSGTRKKVQ